jgi:hypothetical protein
MSCLDARVYIRRRSIRWCFGRCESGNVLGLSILTEHGSWIHRRCDSHLDALAERETRTLATRSPLSPPKHLAVGYRSTSLVRDPRLVDPGLGLFGSSFEGSDRMGGGLRLVISTRQHNEPIVINLKVLVRPGVVALIVLLRDHAKLPSVVDGG